MQNIQRIAVIGAGTMGAGIAQTAAAAGFAVKLIDTKAGQTDAALKRMAESLARMVKKGSLPQAEAEAILKRIEISSQIAGLGDRDAVIEAVFENESVKREVWGGVAESARADALFGTNTSSISITQLAQHVPNPERMIGMHFFNPVPVMKLVEVIRGNRTSDATCAATLDLAKRMGKTPIEVRDYPGFVSNRVLMPLINEAIFAVYEGVATPAAIDDVFKLGMAHPMGPLALADFIGLDVCLDILEVLQKGFGDPKYRACPLLRQMVAAGKLGKKSGEGFYNYPPA